VALAFCKVKGQIMRALLIVVVLVCGGTYFDNAFASGFAQAKMSTVAPYYLYSFSFLGQHVFLILAVLPGIIAICAHILTVPKRRQALQREHRRYQGVEEAIEREQKELEVFDSERKEALTLAQKDAMIAPQDKSSTSSSADEIDSGVLLQELAPGLPGICVGAVILTTIFLIAAALSDGPIGIGQIAPTARPAASPHPDTDETRASGNVSDPPPINSTPTAIPPVSAGVSEKPSAADTLKPTPTDTQGSSSAPSRGLPEGKRALVIAAYGSYITTVYLLINRLNSSGVSGTFLVNSGLRTAIALILAFVAGDFGVFGNIATPDQGAVLYLLLGMFPVWAIDFIRGKGLAIFQVNEAGCEITPLCLVDGLDDGIVDRLAETGIWDIQHIAVAEPRSISARTLYQLDRVVDWIDQALLIVFVKSDIVHYRALGIRAATNLAEVFCGSEGKVFSLLNAIDQQKNAKVLLQNLATKTNVPIETVQHIGRRLSENYRVKIILVFTGQYRTGPIDVARLIDAVFEAVSKAAHAGDIKFEPDPRLGNAVSPILESKKTVVTDLLTAALAETLAPLGYQWVGAFSDISNLNNWSDVVNTILNKTIST
jgi:hypothetical protein